MLQPWYANNMAMMGASKQIARVFQLLMEKGPKRGLLFRAGEVVPHLPEGGES